METTLATSLGEIGEVRAEPNGNLIVPSLDSNIHEVEDEDIEPDPSYA